MGRKKKIEEDLEVRTSDEIRDMTRSIGDIAEECYTLYGSYVNNFRALANVCDGCKVSYKRIIYMSTLQSKGQYIPTHEFVASLSKIHPHGVTGCEDLNANLVKSGIFDGHGFFGNIQIDGVVNPHAAVRYTKNKLSDRYWEVLGELIKEVEMIESPQGPLEPTYIPLPLPLCLYMKSGVEGLGIGINCKYPSFTAKSLYQAYKENNPYLLEPSIDIFIDKGNSELERLWKTGKGRVIYSYKISRRVSDDKKSEGILFEGETGIFTPKISKFNKLVEDGKVYIEDMTDDSGPKLFVGRVPGAKGVTIDDIEKIARKICYDPTVYNLNVTDGLTAFRIPLYDWIDYTYKNYISLLQKVNIKKIEKCKFDISVAMATPYIADYILNKNPKASDAEIAKELKLPKDVIEVVMSKPISHLRKNKDTNDRINSLKKKLKELEAFDPVKYTEMIINLL